MGIYLNPGNEEFQKALNSKIYVDKTMLISEMNQNLNTEHQNICVSRPRRFGKSMTAYTIYNRLTTIVSNVLPPAHNRHISDNNTSPH